MLFSQVGLPSTGVNLEFYVGAAVGSLGTVVAVCVGVYFAWPLIARGLVWAARCLAIQESFK